MTKQEKVKEITLRLRKIYPHPKIALHFSTPLELLIATMLAAQTTDKLVNQITPVLFSKYKTANDYAHAPVEELELLISKVNFYRNKAKAIREASKIIDEQYRGNVPNTMQALDALPGVARKTANVVLGSAFHNAEGIVVDTHVMRLSKKLGLTDKKTPEKIEEDLMQIVPKNDWIDFPNMLTLFGREYCPAKAKSCAHTALGDLFVDE